MPTFRAVRILLLLVVLCAVSVNACLTRQRSTDWDDSLYLKIYPINGDGSDASRRYIATLDVESFKGLETFMQREVERHGRRIQRPVRVRLGREISAQPPSLDDPSNVLRIVWWSLRLRWWAVREAGPQDDPAPDIRMFVRYHDAEARIRLDDSVGLQKGMVGIVNARAGRNRRGETDVVIAHELLHTLGASDKYDSRNGQPLVPLGLAEPGRIPLYPQRYAEIMGGRIAVAENEARMPRGLEQVLIGAATAKEIRLR